MAIDYVNLEGLEHFYGNLKTYLSTKYTTKEELEAAIANFGGFQVVTLDQQGYPDVASPSTKIIYLTKEAGSSKTDPYTEWICTNVVVPVWEIIGETSIEITEMVGATASTDGVSGIVPLPHAGDQGKFLKGDASWDTVVQSVKVGGTALTPDADNAVNVPLASATSSGGTTTYVQGAMTGQDKEKLDSALSFSRVTVVESEDPLVTSNLDASSLNDTLQLVAGDNVTLEAGLVIGGRQYKTVKIGNQVWMAENLDFLPEGIELHDSFDLTAAQSDFYEPVAWYYNNDKATAQSRNCGLLYNSEAVDYLVANTNTMFPGWHVPTKADIDALIANGSSPSDSVFRNSLRKAVSWADTDWYNSTCTNTTGFDGIPSGNIERQWKSTLPYFRRGGTAMHFWTRTDGTGTGINATRYYASLTGYSYFDTPPGYKVGYACSIRLVKDDAVPPNRVRISSDAALEKSVYGTYVTDEQGNAITGENGELAYSENSVELYDTFKDTKFGAARATADRLGNVIDETYLTADGTVARAIADAEGNVISTTYLTTTGTAARAIADASGNDIETTYATKSELPTVNDAKLKLQLGSDQASDTGFTANAASDTTVTIPEMTGATSLANGTAGLVPAPAAGDQDKVLKGDGTWGEAGSSVRVSYDAQAEELHMDFSPPKIKIVSIGGRDYPYVQIGNQLWLAENLDFKPTGISVGSNAWYYDNDEATYGVNGNKYGLLYNWNAIKYLDDNKATLFPDGWHFSTATEWDALATAVGGSGVAGTKLKSTTGWSSGNGDGSYGFAAFPAGHRYLGSFYYVGSVANFWTATEYSSAYAYNRNFDTGASMNSYDNDKTTLAFSVRLVKTLT